jgi:hypothetical protein
MGKIGGPSSGVEQLSGIQYRAADRFRQFGRHKRFLGIQIIFPGFIDHSQMPRLLHPDIRNANVNLPTLQRYFIP